MKIVVTGSLGRISKPLTEILTKQGHEVTVVSSKEDRRKDIEALGAKAAIGSIADVPFLIETFRGADAVYAMSPPDFSKTDMVAYQADNGRDYAEAIKASGVKRVVFLSSFGAHRSSGTGIIVGKYLAEKTLAALTGVAITTLRPTSFYYNFNSLAGMIKATGSISLNYGAGVPVPLVAPADIAAVAAEELVKPVAPGYDVRYIASDERTGHQVAAVLGAAIGKPDLQWKLITDAQMQANLERAGLPAKLAHDLAEMYGGLYNGAMSEDYYQNKPAQTGKVKLEDYAKDFAALYEGGGNGNGH